MQVGMKHTTATNFKFQLPLDEMPRLSKKNINMHDFQPIIIEEVFYHKMIKNERDHLVNGVSAATTPQQIAQDRIKVIKGNKSSNLNSFLSAGQSTQMGGYPKLTPHNKQMIKKHLRS